LFRGIEISCADKLHVVAILDGNKKKEEEVIKWLDEKLISEKDGVYVTSLEVMDFFTSLGAITYIAHIYSSNINKDKFLNGRDIESLQLGNRFELGVDLSGGEWQQLVFCRTLMRKNMNLLVLDEPNSGLDVLSEKRIYDILNEQLYGVTKVIVTHRLQLIDLQGY